MERYTGREVPVYDFSFNPFDREPDETDLETRIVKKEEISEKEFRAIKEKDEEAGMIR